VIEVADMIHVIATIQTTPGQTQAFLAAFRQLVPLVRAEAGCIEYGPAVDVQTPIAIQAPIREDVVTVIEKWASVEALQDHLAAPHMQKYREQVKDLVLGVEIQVLEPA
jgi:quinol monooxygenase YgiN